MKSIFTIADKYVYPSLRRLLVVRLRYKGARPAEVARLLGLSRSLVTRYLKGERGKYIDFSIYPDVVRILDHIADSVMNNGIGVEDVVALLSALTLYVLARKYVCKFHAEIDDVNPSTCDICPRIFGGIDPRHILFYS